MRSPADDHRRTTRSTTEHESVGDDHGDYHNESVVQIQTLTAENVTEVLNGSPYRKPDDWVAAGTQVVQITGELTESGQSHLGCPSTDPVTVRGRHPARTSLHWLLLRKPDRYARRVA